MMNTPVTMFVPFAKGMIDVSKRMVYGIAQLEEPTPDLQGDIVSFEATKRAFEAWPGNVREMHNKHKAVGKCLITKALDDSKEMLVGVRISTGAEDTWHKVLDGVLTGFSIGGYATKTQKGYDSQLGKHINKVLDYTLTELSLVDVPANPKCKVLGIQKNFVEPVLAGDVSGKANGMKTIDAVLEMAKQIGDDDEVVLVKVSDIEVKTDEDPEKTMIVLNKDADISEKLTKADLMAAGEMSSGEYEPDESHLDTVRDALAKSFDVMCQAAGIDSVDAFQEAIEEDGINKSFEGRRSAGISRNDVVQIVDAAVGSKTDAIAKSIDQIKEALGSTLSARKGGDNSAPTPVAKVNGAVSGNGQAAGQSVEEIVKSLEPLYSKRGALLAKADTAGQGLNDTEQVEARQVGEEIDRLETAKLLAQSRS